MVNKKYIHNYETQFNSYKKRLDEEQGISKRNKEIISQYIRDNQLKGKISLPTLNKYYDIFITLVLNFTNKDLDKLTKQDYEKIIEKINNRDITIATKQKYWTILKKFGRWIEYGDKIFNGNGFKEYPETVAWINTHIKRKDQHLIRASDILTEQEIDSLIENTDNTRDRAFISILYETGARIGEIGTIRIKDISEHEHGYLIDLSAGKTGERTVIIVFSSAKLTAWLNQHPNKQDKNAYVWVALQEDSYTKHRGEPLTHNSLIKIIHRAKERAGIKRRIYPHLFRHSRVTHLLLDKQISEQTAKVYFGWAPDSKMLAQYSHLTSKDANNAMLRVNGIKINEKESNQGKKASICKNCGKPNDPKDSFCGFCSKPLDFKILMQLEEKNKTANEVLRRSAGRSEEFKISKSILKETIREMIKSGEIKI